MMLFTQTCVSIQRIFSIWNVLIEEGMLKQAVIFFTMGNTGKGAMFTSGILYF